MATTITDKWLETPDILAFMVKDDDPTLPNVAAVNPADSHDYGTWFTATNPLTNNSEVCQVINPDKKFLVFSAKRPTNFVDHINLRNVANYSIDNGLSISAVYFRDEANSQTQMNNGAGTQTLGAGMRRTFYLKLSAAPTPGVTYTIGNATAGLTSFTFTFNDKTTRAGGLKVNFCGHRRADTWRKAYLLSRIPGGPSNGVVDFAGTYGITYAYVIDEDGNTWGGALPVTLRRAWNAQESPSDGYAATGIDVADLAQSWAITSITKGATTAVTAPGHTLANNDKVRFFGINGITGLDGIGVGSLWIAATVSGVSGDDFTVNINSSGFAGTFATGLYDTSLGGIDSRVYKCFNTNRAGTNVYEIDISTFPANKFGTYNIWIPGYGVSDPFTVDNASWAIACAKHHEGTYNQRLGCALTLSPTYQRGVALLDGTNGCENYWSDLPSIWASETSLRVANRVPSANGAYAPDFSINGSFGWVTSTRFNGGPAHQDAGDNDDIGVDHIQGFNALAQIFYELDQDSRFIPVDLPVKASAANPILFAGTDDLPAAFHELAWHFEAYRGHQGEGKGGAGAIPGGWGIGHTSSQVANFPEPIDYYHGTDAGGSLAGQTVHAFVYASDAITNMRAVYGFAKFAQICYDYGLTDAGDAYKQAAIDAYDWSDAIYKSPTARDAYYDTQLSLTSRLGWSQTTKNADFVLHNARVLVQKRNAAGALYRLLGSVDGQTPYGDFIESAYLAAVPTISNGGSGYAVNDLVTLDCGTILNVTTVSSGAITAVSLLFAGESTTAINNTQNQASTTGSGTGAVFTATSVKANHYAAMNGTQGGWEYISTSGAKATQRNYMLAHAYDGLSTNTDYTLSSTTCFQTMIQPGNTAGGTALLSPLTMIQAHMTKRLQNGDAAETSSIYLQSLQAGLSFIQGANMPGKAFTHGMGPRSVQCMLHEDAFKLGAPGGSSPGQTIYGYFAWAAFSGLFAFATGPNTDSASNWVASNVTGDFEASPNLGSKKMWNPPRFMSSYWEFSPENHGLVFPCEFDVVQCSLANLTTSLYLHGWDGNTNTELSPGFVASGHML